MKKIILVLALAFPGYAIAVDTPTHSTKTTKGTVVTPAPEAERGSTTDVYGNATRRQTDNGKNAVGRSNNYRADSAQSGTAPADKKDGKSGQGNGQ